MYNTLFTFCDICHINWCMISSINSTFHNPFTDDIFYDAFTQEDPMENPSKSHPNVSKQKVLQTSQCSKALKIIELGGETITCMSQEFSKRFVMKWVISPQYTPMYKYRWTNPLILTIDPNFQGDKGTSKYHPPPPTEKNPQHPRCRFYARLPNDVASWIKAPVVRKGWKVRFWSGTQKKTHARFSG